MVKFKDERTAVRREFIITYEELCSKFPELPKDASVYGCHWENGKYGGWQTGNEAGIKLTLDFDEMKDGSTRNRYD